MKWTEQAADAAAAPAANLLRTMPALDAIGLLSRLRRAPAVCVRSTCRDGILAHLRSRRTELGGLLLGRAYVVGEGVAGEWKPVICVDDFLPSETFRTSPVSLAMGTEIWQRAREAITRDGRLVVGWYHSHPNLGAFFSGTDRATQRAFFNQAYSVGLVVDAVRGEEAWFIGPEAEPVPAGSVLGVDLGAPA